MKLTTTFICFLLAGQLIAKTVDYIPSPAKDLIKHTYYTLSYNEKYEQANWVYYSLTDSMVLNSGEERSNNFKADKLVTSGSSKSSDYTKSGFDRGHLCPAADMCFNPVAMQESFLMSNISPQTPDFNRGIWKELETTVREWAKKEHHLFVITGPIFKSNKGTIGKDEVLVPGQFFKIIYDPTDSPKMIAFVLPNEKSDRPLTDFVVTTDNVEKLTGYDFFSQLPDNIENKLEGSISSTGWFDGYSHTNQPVISEIRTKDNQSDFKIYLILGISLLTVILGVFLKGKRK